MIGGVSSGAKARARSGIARRSSTPRSRCRERMGAEALARDGGARAGARAAVRGGGRRRAPAVVDVSAPARSGFRLSRRRRGLPILAALGVSDVYLSPPFAAAPGSDHGYDVVDYNAFAAGLGGEEGWEELSRALSRPPGIGSTRRLRAQPHGHRPAKSVVASTFSRTGRVGLRALLRRRLESGQAGARRTRCWCRCSAINSARCSSAASCASRARAAPSSSNIRPRLPGDAAARAAPARPSARRAARPSSAPATSSGARRCESVIAAPEKLVPRDEVSARRRRRARARKEVAKRRLAALFDGGPRIARCSSTRTCASSTATPGHARSFDLLDELLERPGLSPRSLARRRRRDQLPPFLRHQLARRHLRGGRARLLGHAPARFPLRRRRQDHRPAHRSPRRALRAVGLLRRLQTLRAKGSYVGRRAILEEAREDGPAGCCTRRRHLGADGWLSGGNGYDFLNGGSGASSRENERAFSSTRASPACGPSWARCPREEARADAFVDGREECNVLSRQLDRLSESNRRTRDFTRNALTGALVDWWRACRSTAPTSRATGRRHRRRANRAYVE